MAHEANFREQEPESPVKGTSGFKWPRLNRRWLYGLAGLGAVGVIALLFRPAPTRVDGVTVTSGELQVMVEAEGQTRVRDRYIIAAPVDGRLIRIALTEGDPVNATEVVARIDPLPLTSQVTQAQARRTALQAEIAGVDTQRPKDDALAEAEAQITAAQATQQQAEAEVARTLAHWQQAQRDLQRANDLANQGAISAQSQESAALAVTASEQEHKAAQQQLERAIAAVTAAQADRDVLRQEQSDPDYLLDVYQAEIASIDAELARLADDARRTTINAPAAGQVLRILEESARFVTAGTPLLEIGNPEDLEIVIDVLSQDAVKIAVGDRIQVTQWGGDDTLLAEVQMIEPAAFTEVSALGVEEQRVNVIARFIDPQVPLGDGYRVETQIIIDQAESALTVPISALFPCDQGTCVFGIVGGRAAEIGVTQGLSNSFEAVVETGLAAGDVVIAYPESVDVGDRVELWD